MQWKCANKHVQRFRCTNINSKNKFFQNDSQNKWNKTNWYKLRDETATTTERKPEKKSVIMSERERQREKKSKGNVWAMCQIYIHFLILLFYMSKKCVYLPFYTFSSLFSAYHAIQLFKSNKFNFACNGFLLSEKKCTCPNRFNCKPQSATVYWSFPNTFALPVVVVVFIYSYTLFFDFYGVFFSCCVHKFNLSHYNSEIKSEHKSIYFHFRILFSDDFKSQRDNTVKLHKNPIGSTSCVNCICSMCISDNSFFFFFGFLRRAYFICSFVLFILCFSYDLFRSLIATAPKIANLSHNILFQHKKKLLIFFLSLLSLFLSHSTGIRTNTIRKFLEKIEKIQLSGRKEQCFGQFGHIQCMFTKFFHFLLT